MLIYMAKREMMIEDDLINKRKNKNKNNHFQCWQIIGNLIYLLEFRSSIEEDNKKTSVDYLQQS